MEALRTTARRAGTTRGQPPSGILVVARRLMCAAKIYVNNSGDPFPRDFSAVGAPAPSALAEAPPPTAADPSPRDFSAVGAPAPSALGEKPPPTAADPFPRDFSAVGAPAFGAGIFGNNNLCPVPFPQAGQSVTYVIGMFDDVNEPKWNPLEFAESHALLENVNLVGDEEVKEYTIFTELAKVWFASLPLLIEKLKMHGYSFFHPITLSQLMVDRYGQFVMRGGTVLWKTNRHNASKDYFSLAGVYEGIIRHCCRGAILPYSFESLLKELRHRNQQHGYFFTVHPVFIPVPAYSQAYLDVYDHVKENLTHDQAKSIWPSLEGSAKKWAESMAGNTLLVAWFEDPYKQNRILPSEETQAYDPRESEEKTDGDGKCQESDCRCNQKAKVQLAPGIK